MYLIWLKLPRPLLLQNHRKLWLTMKVQRTRRNLSFFRGPNLELLQSQVWVIRKKTPQKPKPKKENVASTVSPSQQEKEKEIEKEKEHQKEWDEERQEMNQELHPPDNQKPDESPLISICLAPNSNRIWSPTIKASYLALLLKQVSSILYLNLVGILFEKWLRSQCPYHSYDRNHQSITSMALALNNLKLSRLLNDPR